MVILTLQTIRIRGMNKTFAIYELRIKTLKGLPIAVSYPVKDDEGKTWFRKQLQF